MKRRSLIVALSVISALAVLPVRGSRCDRTRRRAGAHQRAVRDPGQLQLDARQRPQHIAVGLSQRRAVRDAGQQRPDPARESVCGQHDRQLHRQRGGRRVLLLRAGRRLVSTANSPGLTVIVDTHDPAATIAIPNASAAGSSAARSPSPPRARMPPRALPRACSTSARPDPAHRVRSWVPPGIRRVSATVSTTSATSSPTMPATSPSPRSP